MAPSIAATLRVVTSSRLPVVRIHQITRAIPVADTGLWKASTDRQPRHPAIRRLSIHLTLYRDPAI